LKCLSATAPDPDNLWLVDEQGSGMYAMARHSGRPKSSRSGARICAVLLLTLLAGHPAQGEQRPAGHAEVSLLTLAPLIKRAMPSVVA